MFWTWWQQLPTTISPYLVDFGVVRVHWYGLMYVAAFITIILLVSYRLRTESFSITKEQFIGSLQWAIIGLLVGARIGHVLIFEPLYYAQNPLNIISPFAMVNGQIQVVGIAGLSFFGAIVGIAVALWWYCKRQNINFWELSKLAIPAVPLGYTFGRIGNFLNGELYGRATNLPWGMRFPRDSELLLRHPSQLYEGFLEGIVLFLILWPLRKKETFDGFFLSLYIGLYGLLRFVVEFVREPDPQHGTILAGLTITQLFSILMMIGAVLFFLYKRKSHGMENVLRVDE